MSVLVAAVLAVLAIAILFGPRRGALLAMLVATLFLTQGERVFVAGINMFPTRILEVFLFLRVVARGEMRQISWNGMDKALLALTGYTVLFYAFRTSDGLSYQVGSAADALLCYFGFRALIQGFEDFNWLLRTFAALLVPYAAIVGYEWSMERNLFELIGGVPVGHFYRGGHPRSYGSFRHPSLMGSVGATTLPLFLSIINRKESRWVGVVGAVCCLALVVFSNSGGPINTMAMGIAGWGIWRYRANMRKVRLILLSSVIALAIVMKAPIYYLPAKVGLITGGGGFHRSYLIEMAIKDFDKWYLFGVDIEKTAGWFPYVLDTTGGADMTNYFLSYGVRAGFGAVILLILLLVIAYKQLGRGLSHVRLNPMATNNGELMLWGLGVMLAAHISNWFSISYWDQFCVILYLHLSLISSLGEAAQQTEYADESADVELEAKPVTA